MAAARLSASSEAMPTLIAVCLPVLLYGISLNGNFVFDDLESVVQNKDVNSLTPLSTVFGHDFWGNNITTNTSHKSYRPFAIWTYQINCYLAGGLFPFGFHLVNMLLYMLSCLLAMKFYRNILFDLGFIQSLNEKTLVATLLFIVHPIHSECVANITGRCEVLSSVFYFSSFLFYRKSILKNSHKLSSLFYLLFSWIFALFALLSKEQGVTILVFNVFYDWIHFAEIKFRFYKISVNWQKVRVVLARSVATAGFLFLCFYGRLWVMAFTNPVFQPHDNPQSFLAEWYWRGINYIYLYWLNLWLLLAPVWLCFDWSIGCVPVINTWTDYRLVFVLICILFGCLIIRAIFSDQLTSRVTSIGTSLIVIPFLPASNLVVRVGFVVAERVLFLPSFGFCLLVAEGYSRLKLRRKFFCLCVLLLCGTLQSVHRATLWNDEINLYEAGLHVCPLNAKVHYNIAKLNSERGNNQRALSEYHEAIRLYPDYEQALNNLGNLYKDMGQLQTAKTYLTRATVAKSDFAAGWMNLGIVLAALNETDEAEAAYRRALQHRKRYPDCWFNLGNLHHSLGRQQDALSAWNEAIRQKPRHEPAWGNLIRYLTDLKQLDAAFDTARMSLKSLPESARLWNQLGFVLGVREEWSEGELAFLKAIELDPHNADYNGNLGVLYHRMNERDKAIIYYQRALQIDPHHKSTLKNIGSLVKSAPTG